MAVEGHPAVLPLAWQVGFAFSVDQVDAEKVAGLSPSLAVNGHGE